MNLIPRRSPGLGLRERVRYAIVALWFRKGMTAMNVASVGVAVVYFLVLSFYGLGLFCYQRSLVDESALKSVTASWPEPTDTSRWFNAARLATLRQQPGVVNAFGRIEVGVKLFTDPGTRVQATAEGTVPGRAALAAGRRVWGRAPAATGHEAALPLPLFSKAGGKVGPDGPVPETLTLEVARTTEGREEKHTLRLRVVGLLRATSAEKVYLPLSVAEHLDQWCAHRIRSMPGPDGRLELPRLVHDVVLAFGPKAHQDRVAGEAKQFQADIKATAGFAVLDRPGDVWLALDGDAGAIRQALAGTIDFPVRPKGVLCLGDIHYPRVAGRLEAAGLRVRPLTPIRESFLVEYEVRPARGSAAGAELVAALAMAQPTFTQALPRVRVQALLGNDAFVLEGSQPADPRRFRVGVRHGRWLAGNPGEREVVLPAALAAALGPGKALADWVGREVELGFARQRGVSDADPRLTLTCRVAGVVEGRVGYLPLEWAEGLALWSQGQVVYNEARGGFESKAAIHERYGHLRCTIDLESPQAVADLVAWLEAQGYRAEHHLAEQQGLYKLGRVLVFLVLLFVVGFLSNALITVLLSNAQMIAHKTHEIGVLRSLGVSAREIVSIFAIQGAVGGAVAFLAGGLLVAAVEPFFSGLVLDTFRLPAEALPARLLSPGHWPLYLAALLLALGATVVGAVLPALRACRLTPVQAMQRQE